MAEKFSKEEAIRYCKNHHVNVLKSDRSFIEAEAVFKLFSVSEDLLMHYIVEGLEDADEKIITTEELILRKVDYVWLDTSEIRMIAGEYVNI